MLSPALVFAAMAALAVTALSQGPAASQKSAMPPLRDAVEQLERGEGSLVLPRRVALAELEGASPGQAVETRGRLRSFAGQRVMVLADGRATALVILTDPTQSDQQATFRLGDVITVVGIATLYDRAQVDEAVTGDMDEIDLSAYAGRPTILATSIRSFPGEEVPQPSQVEPETRGTAGELPEEGAASEAPGQAETPPQPTIIVEPAPTVIQESSLYLSTPTDLLDRPEVYLERTVTFDAYWDDVPGDMLARLDLAAGLDTPDLLIVLDREYPFMADGTRVRVTGRLTTLSFSALEATQGVDLGDAFALEREEDEPVFVVSEVIPLRDDGIFTGDD